MVDRFPNLAKSATSALFALFRSTFTSKTINTTGCHNTRVGDVTGDGRVDLLCNNYLGNPPVQLYINQAVGTFLHAGGPCAVAGQSAVQLYVPPDTSPNDNKAASEVFMPKTCAGPAVATFSAWVVAPAGTKILVRMVARCVGSGGQTNNPCTVGQEVAAAPRDYHPCIECGRARPSSNGDRALDLFKKRFVAVRATDRRSRYSEDHESNAVCSGVLGHRLEADRCALPLRPREMLD